MIRLLLIALVGCGLAAQDATPRATLEPGDAVPMYINYQGYLTDTLGTPITATLSMGFTIYADSLGGNGLWSSLQTVPVVQGVFNTKLALAPGDTALFRTNARRWLELRVSGYTMSPRTEITSMAYGIHADKADNADQLDGRHAADLVWNTSTMQASSNFYISGTGRANVQLAALGSGLPGNSAALVGMASGKNHGAYGQSSGANGVFGYSQEDSAFGALGYNSNSRGTGVAGAGCNDTIYYLTCGTGGAFTARHIGLFAYSHDTTGTGVATMGTRIRDTVYTLASGSGGSFNGTTVGVYGLARNETGNRCGGFFRTFGSDTTYAYVAYNYNGADYKILGEGLVSTVMATRGGRRILFAPESPEPYFEDFGSAQLVNGHCRIDLDPLFRDCITCDASHPLRVYITPNDDCLGMYVRTDAAGFDVHELQGGRSNARFSYRVIASRRGNTDLRLPVAPELPASVGTPVGSEPSLRPVH